MAVPAASAGDRGIAALSRSEGLVAQAVDAEILDAQRALSAEGVFAEPAEAAPDFAATFAELRPGRP